MTQQQTNPHHYKDPNGPPTQSMVDYLLSLCEQRDVMGGFVAEEAKAAVLAGIAGGLTKEQVGGMIERALKAPTRPSLAKIGPLPEPGYYKGEDGGFYVVVFNKAKTRRYAKKLYVRPGPPKSAIWRYSARAIYALSDSTPLTLVEAAAFGHLHGVCFKCGKPLTDPESVARGIGPVCIESLKGR